MTGLKNTPIDKSNITVGELLTTQVSKLSAYRRPYKWTPGNRNNLFNEIRLNLDMEACNLGYFVFYQHDKSDAFEIIDGQQRLLTLMKWFWAVLEHIRKPHCERLTAQLFDVRDSLEAFFERPSYSSEESDYLLHQCELGARHYVRHSRYLDEEINRLLNHCFVDVYVIRQAAEIRPVIESTIGPLRNRFDVELTKIQILTLYLTRVREVSKNPLLDWK